MDRISLVKIIMGVLLAVLFISGCTGDIDEMKKGTAPEAPKPTPTAQETVKEVEEMTQIEGSTTESLKTPLGTQTPVTDVEEKQTAQVVVSGSSSSSVKQSEKQVEQEGVESKPFGYLQLLVSDKPADISDFAHLYVEFYRARIFKAEDSYGYGYGYGDGKGFVEVDLNATVDLTELVGENAMPIAEIQLEEGVYTKIELYVESTQGLLYDGYGYGYGYEYTVADVKVPSNKLKIVKPFEIKSGEETKFVFDINVVKKGNKDEYNLLPVIAKSGVVGEDLKESEIKIIKK